MPPWAPLNPVDSALRNILNYFFMLFPNFSKFDVTPQLSEGMIISLGTVISCFLWLIIVRGGILALTGWLIFKRRELAADQRRDLRTSCARRPAGPKAAGGRAVWRRLLECPYVRSSCCS